MNNTWVLNEITRLYELRDSSGNLVVPCNKTPTPPNLLLCGPPPRIPELLDDCAKDLCEKGPRLPEIPEECPLLFCSSAPRIPTIVGDICLTGGSSIPTSSNTSSESSNSSGDTSIGSSNSQSSSSSSSFSASSSSSFSSSSSSNSSGSSSSSSSNSSSSSQSSSSSSDSSSNSSSSNSSSESSSTQPSTQSFVYWSGGFLDDTINIDYQGKRYAYNRIAFIPEAFPPDPWQSGQHPQGQFREVVENPSGGLDLTGPVLIVDNVDIPGLTPYITNVTGPSGGDVGLTFVPLP